MDRKMLIEVQNLTHILRLVKQNSKNTYTILDFLSYFRCIHVHAVTCKWLQKNGDSQNGEKLHPHNWSYRSLWAAMSKLETKFRSSRNIARSPNWLASLYPA